MDGGKNRLQPFLFIRLLAAGNTLYRSRARAWERCVELKMRSNHETA